MRRLRSPSLLFTNSSRYAVLPWTRRPLVRCFIQSSSTAGVDETNLATARGVLEFPIERTIAEPIVQDQQKIEPEDPPKPRKLAAIVDEELPPLTPEQKEVLGAILEGRNVFIGGPARSGKGAIIEHLTHHLSRLGKPYQVLNLQKNYETAHMGWQPMASFFGLSKIPTEKAVKRARWGAGWSADLSWTSYTWIESELAIESPHLNPWNSYAIRSRADRWDIYKRSRIKLRRPEVVVITGATSSSLSLTNFEKLNLVAKLLWEKPSCFFGGAQLVLAGDFFQMHSPSRSDLKQLEKCFFCGTEYPKPPPTKYTCKRCRQLWDTCIRHLFEGPSWTEANFKSFTLERKPLNLHHAWEEVVENCKSGKPDEQSLLFLETLQESRLPIGNIKRSQIHASSKAARCKNELELQSLPGALTVFPSCDASREEVYERCKDRYERITSKPIPKNAPHPDVKALNVLQLKIGAQVMLTATLDAELDLIPGSRGVVDGFTQISKTDFLAAVATKETAKLDAKYFDIYCDPATQCVLIPMVSFYALLQRKIIPTSVPVFPQIFRQKIPTSDARHKEQHDVFLTVERRQIPLRLAWALPMQQMVGITVDYAQIDVNDMSEPGYMYTALSCVRRSQGLQLLAADRNHLVHSLKCDTAVVRFYEGLTSQAKEINDVAQ